MFPPARLLRFLARRHEPIAVFVDVDDPSRRRAIREAEYQRELDRCSCVLRVSGQRKWPAVVRRPVMEWVKRS